LNNFTLTSPQRSKRRYAICGAKCGKSARSIFRDRAGLADIITHIVVGGADHVTGIAFVDQLGHGAGAQQSYVIGVRLNGREHLPWGVGFPFFRGRVAWRKTARKVVLRPAAKRR
jgi:hypothetical protein